MNKDVRTAEAYREQIGELARAYYVARFPHASTDELGREIKDWVHKVESSRGVVLDFTRKIGNPGGMAILDCGSGSDGLSIAFAEAGANMTGVDIEEALVIVAQKNAALYAPPHAPRFLCYDGTQLPFSDHSFDAALSVSVLEHVDDPARYLSEIWRVLKPGGKLYLAFPNRLWPRETHTHLWGISYVPYSFAESVVRLLGRNPLEANNLHFYSYRALKRFVRALQNNGRQFTIEKDSGTRSGTAITFIKKFFEFLGLSYKILLPHIMVVMRKTS